ncbi:MAG: pitrilysin family protein [Bacillota bacterium]|nr:pitrilysin family protein [Bacillota bacterium]
MDRDIFDTKEHTLENGVKLVTIRKDTQLASIHAGVKMGSLYERKEQKGVSHFIEHMLFKGTINRSNEQLNNELEQLGGEYNAYTDYNCTVYSITALCEELGLSIELLADMLQYSNFPQEEIDKERDVILAEIRTSKDDVEDYSYKRANEAAFKISPLRYDAIGDEKTVKKFTREELLKFYNRYYVPNNCYIVVVSPFEHSQVFSMIQNCFGNWKFKKFCREKVEIENNINTKKISYKNDIEQSSIIYVFTFHGLDRKQELALKILEHKFGESTNSILFREVREKRGLAYDIYSDIDTTKYVKTLYIYTAVSKENVQETLDCIDGCIKDVVEEKIVFNENIISLMKKVLKTAVISTIEDTTDLCNYVIHQIIDGDDIYEFLVDMENLEIIKKEDIYGVAKLVFNKPTVHILFPKESD